MKNPTLLCPIMPISFNVHYIKIWNTNFKPGKGVYQLLTKELPLRAISVPYGSIGRGLKPQQFYKYLPLTLIDIAVFHTTLTGLLSSFAILLVFRKRSSINKPANQKWDIQISEKVQTPPEHAWCVKWCNYLYYKTL